MEDFADSAAFDAGILAAAQAVEHYEITRYGSLKTWAGELGMSDAAKLLDQNLRKRKIPTSPDQAGRGPREHEGCLSLRTAISEPPAARRQGFAL